MNSTMNIYQKCLKLPFGKQIFSILLCHKVPYFNSIKPRFIELRPGFSKVFLKKRRAVTNHLGSVHAIAMCNVSELAAGIALETCITKTMRWVPKSMTVSYLKIAETDLTAVCEIAPEEIEKPGEVQVSVQVSDLNGMNVFNAQINMYLTTQKRKGA